MLDRLCEVCSRESHFYQLARLANCALGREGAIGAGRKLPAHSRVPSLTNAESPPSPCRVVIKNGAPRVAWYTYIAVGGGIFALRRPRPYSRHCEEIVGGITVPTIIYAPQTSTGIA